MTEMFGEAWSPMSVPDMAPDGDEYQSCIRLFAPSDLEPNVALWISISWGYL